MSHRSATWLAWSSFGLYVLIVAATFALVWFGPGTSDDALVAIAIGYAAVGALVASREPSNSIGWLLLAIAIGFGLSNLAFTYGRDPGLPGVVAAAWFADPSGYVPLYLATLMLPLLFPTGRLLSPRWWPALAMSLVALALSMVGAGLAEGTLVARTPVAASIENPLAVGGVFGRVVEAGYKTGVLLALAGLVVGVAALVVRLRGSRGRERQQLKMLVYVIGALLLDIVLLTLGGAIPGPWDTAWIEELAYLIGVLLVVLGLPLAIGIAILRHRLYDIDLVINRTLVYGALTLTLAVAYLGLFFLLQELVLGPATGGSDLAVAGSTLVVAALSRPARTRIQTAVDRRFYRQRYDASRTLDAFAVRLRDELDLETVAGDLQEVALDTMQSTHVSLWLRGAER